MEPKKQNRDARLREYFAEIEECHPGFGGIHPVTIRSANILGDTPLQVAVRRGDILIVGDMIDTGADINARGEYGYTPLHYAVSFGHTEIARLLLSRGASSSIRNDDGRTALDIATSSKDRAMMDLFHAP